MYELTVIQYTNNREKPAFAEKIQRHLLETIGDMPLVTVSQYPMTFGKNICIGDVGISAQNLFRQMLIAAQTAETRFVCPAEADMLYPPEYFQFRPPRDDIFYLAMPLWVLFAQRGYGKTYCLKPRGSESAMVVNRQLLVDRLTQVLDGLEQWGSIDADGVNMAYLLDRKFTKRDYFQLAIPVVTFKTDENIHRKTPHDVHSRTRELPYWGTAAEMLDRFCTR